jgi:hypothetical protein
MKKMKRHSNKAVRYVRSTQIASSNFSREAWVESVLRLASFRYNLEPEDFEIYVNKNRRKLK